MNTFLEKTVSNSNILDTIQYYEELGFTVINTKRIDHNNVILVLQGDKDLIGQHSKLGDKSFIQFEDGLTSPLYIKREKTFWED